jgi:hypothetical protein
MSPVTEYAAADGAAEALAEVVFDGCALTASVVVGSGELLALGVDESVVVESVVVVAVAGVVVPSVGVAVVVEDVVGVVVSVVSLSSRPVPGDRTATDAPLLEADVDAGCLPVGRARGPVDLFAPPVVVE